MVDRLRRAIQLLTLCGWLVAAVALAGCDGPGPHTPRPPGTERNSAPVVTAPVSVPERFQTEPTAADLDSIGIWHGPDASWLIVTSKEEDALYVLFDRKTFRHVGAFSGPATSNTDGVTLSMVPLPGFPRGAFYAIDDDRRVSAFDWAEIAAALTLPDPCRPAA